MWIFNRRDGNLDFTASLPRYFQQLIDPFLFHRLFSHAHIQKSGTTYSEQTIHRNNHVTFETNSQTSALRPKPPAKQPVRGGTTYKHSQYLRLQLFVNRER